MSGRASPFGRNACTRGQRIRATLSAALAVSDR